MRQRSNNLTQDEKRTQNVVNKSVHIDEGDVNSTNIEYNRYLQLAVEHYIQTLLLETEHETYSSAMFRLFGLWFSNLSSMEISKEIEDNYKKIPAHKFITLMPQITTQLGTDGIADIIEDIVCVCAKRHPHHVLPKVMELFNAFKDEDFVTDPKQKMPISNSPRTIAAGQLLQKLKSFPELREIIVQMERMCEGTTSQLSEIVPFY